MILAVYNPASSSFDRDAFEAALAASFDTDEKACGRYETEGGDGAFERLSAAVRDAVERGCDLVLAAGGDGTVSAVANALAAIDAPARPLLAIVPQGTANVLARELEVPIDVAGAMALAAARARTMAIDAIQVGPRAYLTQLGAGLDARMIAGTSRADQDRRGRLAYIAALVREMTGYRSHKFDLTIDGQLLKIRAWQVVVANAKTMGTPPFTWGPEIEPDDGVLDVGVYDVRSVLDWLRLVIRFLTGRHRRDRRARYFQAQRAIRIASHHPIPVQADGDVIGDTPVDIAVATGLLRVVCGPVPEPAPSAAPAESPAPPAPPPPVPEDASGVPSVGAPTTGPIEGAARAVRLSLWERLEGFDHAAYRWVNRLPAGSASTRLARIASRTMDHGELWIVVAALVAVLGPAHHWRSMVVLVAVMWLVELTVNYPIKAAFRRTRPYHALEGVDVRVARLPRDWSFPSGHSATAFAGAALLSVFVPVLAPLFFAWAAIVALSRVYVGVHYPVDIVLGAAIGLGLATLYGGVAFGLLAVPQAIG